MFKRKKKKNNNNPTKLQSQILSTYDIFDDDDISTETLLCLVADTCDCDIDDVVDTLAIFRAE